MKNYQLSRDVDVKFDLSEVKLNTKNVRYPNSIDLRDFCLPTNNQGNTPHCVGYTVAAYFEIFNWRKTHVPVQFNAEKIYRFGREFKPDTISGTKIEYCLNGMLKNDVFSGDIVSFSGNSNCSVCDVIKAFVHEYGCFMSAFYITDEWFNLNIFNCVRVSKKDPKSLGGHCVVCCGYNKTGMYIQNSWGYQNWGNYGFAVIPWKLVEKQFCYGVVVNDFCLKEKAEEIKLNGLSSTTRDN